MRNVRINIETRNIFVSLIERFSILLISVNKNCNKKNM